MTPAVVVILGPTTGQQATQIEAHLAAAVSGGVCRTRVIVPEGLSADAATSEAFALASEDIPQWTQDIASDAMSFLEAGERGVGTLHVFLCGHAVDAGVRALSAQLAIAVRDRMAQLLTGLAVHAEVMGIFALPRPGQGIPAELFAWYREVISCSGFQEVYLLAPSNRDRQVNPDAPALITEEEHEELIAEACELLITTDFHARIAPARAVRPRGPFAPIAGIGIASLFFPTATIKENGARALASHVLTFLLGDDAAGVELAKVDEVSEFKQREGTRPGDLLNSVIAVPPSRDTVFSRLSFQRLDYRKIALAQLPRRIRSYGDYLGYERVAELGETVIANRQATEDRVLESVRAEMERLGDRPPKPCIQRTRQFLCLLHGRAGHAADNTAVEASAHSLSEDYATCRGYENVHSFAAEIEENEVARQSRFDEASEGADLDACFQELADLIANRPLPSALVTRWGLLGLVTGLPVALLARMTTHAAGAAPPTDVVAACVLGTGVFAACVGTAVLQVREYAARIFAQAEDFMADIVDLHRRGLSSFVMEQMRGLYRQLLARIDSSAPTAAQDAAQAEQQQPPQATEPGELQHLDTCAEALRLEVKGLTQVTAPETLFRMSCLPLIPHRQFTYREQSNVDVEAVLQELYRDRAPQGLGWLCRDDFQRPQAIQQTIQRVKAFAGEGFEWVDRLDMLNEVAGAPADALQQTADRLSSVSQVYLTFDRTNPRTGNASLVGMVGHSKQEAMAAFPLRFAPTAVFDIQPPERNRLLTVQVAWAIPPNEVLTAAQWREAYASLADVSDLHPAFPDLNLIPDPMAAIANASAVAPDDGDTGFV
jgi:hypothetical protein